VTVLEANGEPDAGDVWASRTFCMRETGKSSLYRHEVRRAAIEALVEAVDKVVRGRAPDPLDYGDGRVTGEPRPPMPQDVRAIDWQADRTDDVLRKGRAAEGHPGVLDVVAGNAFHLFGAHREDALRGRPGEIVARRDEAICRATADGAVWITHLERPGSFKLPATRALALAGHEVTAPDVPVPVDAPRDVWREIAYEEDGAVGYLHFDFYNGAMSTEQCRRLREAYAFARSRPTKSPTASTSTSSRPPTTRRSSRGGTCSPSTTSCAT
jgi:putative two-component system hydrogenase maturation factor HypX/HoxX